MCRRNQLCGVFAAGLGIGMLLSCLFESGFFCCCVGIGLIITGVLVIQKN